MPTSFDVVIIGSGPNGLSAGICLVEAGLSVLILEAKEFIGGGMRTKELTLDSFRHDVCSAIHPMAFLSPYWQTLELEKYGLKWIFPEASVAHPLDDEPAVILEKCIVKTAVNLGSDADHYQRILLPFVENNAALISDLLRPLSVPQNPLLFSKFGLQALTPANLYAEAMFTGKRAKALFAGCVGHSTLPFNKLFSTAFGLIFLAMGHTIDWPFPKGGANSLANALYTCFIAKGGLVHTSTKINNFSQLPPAQVYLFDTDPYQVAKIAQKQLPLLYRKRLQRYYFGPAVFKIDYALSEQIPWTDPRCNKASTVHLGGTFEEIAASEKAVWAGKHSPNPYVILAQQSLFDDMRAPSGQHTCWAYCHTPNGSTQDVSHFIESQIERFAPGFRQTILAKHRLNAGALERYNANYVGGAISGGAATISQLFARPVLQYDSYRTPNSKIFMCSSATPPGGGVHGMNGFYAAQSILRRLKR